MQNIKTSRGQLALAWEVTKQGLVLDRKARKLRAFLFAKMLSHTTITKVLKRP